VRSPSEMSLRPSEQTELRRSSFKASVSVADGLRRRVSAMDSIRKESRGSALRRKRCSEVAPHAQSQPPALEKKVGFALVFFFSFLFSHSFYIRFVHSVLFGFLIYVFFSFTADLFVPFCLVS